MTAARTVRAKGRERRSRRGGNGPTDLRDLATAAAFLAPAMLGFIIFYFRPTVIGFWNSFTDRELLRPNSNFVGLDNYQEMISDDVFWNALWVTSKYVVLNIGFQTIVAIGIAWILDRLSGSRVIRTLVPAPWPLEFLCRPAPTPVNGQRSTSLRNGHGRNGRPWPPTGVNATCWRCQQFAVIQLWQT